MKSVMKGDVPNFALLPPDLQSAIIENIDKILQTIDNKVFFVHHSIIVNLIF